MRVWEISHMRKPKPAPGISARLPAMFRAVQPSDMSLAKWMEKARVSGKFLNDVEDGSEPGIDKVERMANVAGLSLADFLAGKAAGADTPPPAWIPKQTTVVRILEVFGPYAWANLNDEGSLREVADAIASVFGTISNDRAIEDNPDELSGALKSAAYSLRGLPQAPRPSKPSTQRHKLDKP